jgi:hypothetical protein
MDTICEAIGLNGTAYLFPMGAWMVCGFQAGLILAKLIIFKNGLQKKNVHYR